MSFWSSKVRKNSFLSNEAIKLFIKDEKCAFKVLKELSSINNVRKLSLNNINEKLSKKSFSPFALDCFVGYFMDDSISNCHDSYMSVDYVCKKLNLGEFLPIGKLLCFMMGKVVSTYNIYFFII